MAALLQFFSRLGVAGDDLADDGVYFLIAGVLARAGLPRRDFAEDDPQQVAGQFVLRLHGLPEQRLQVHRQLSWCGSTTCEECTTGAIRRRTARNTCDTAGSATSAPTGILPDPTRRRRRPSS